jgi:hypothetical protein
VKKLIIILYPFKFRKFDWERFEIDELKKLNEVVVFDFINVLYPHFKKAYFVDKGIKKKIIRIDSITKYKKKIDELIQKHNKKNILIVNFIKADSIKSLLINYFLKRKNLKSLSFFNPGISTYNLSTLKNKYNKLISFKMLFKKKGETIQKIQGKFINIMVKMLRIYPNFMFVAGEKCKKDILQDCRKKNIEIIKGSSWDFSKILKEKKDLINLNFDYAVYVDSPGPKFLSDSYLFKDKYLETTNHTYPSLNKFFTFIENKMKLKIIIAPHPKTKIKNKSSLFDYREVVSGKTLELIKNSKLVITRASTATTFAAYYKKPIIFFYTNETFNEEPHRSSAHLSKSLNLKTININKFNEYNLNNIIKFNKNVYNRYLNNYCTFKSIKQQNFIILNKLLN